MKKLMLFLLVMLFPMVAGAHSAEADLTKGSVFEVKNPDMKLSPYTGMTRDVVHHTVYQIKASFFRF